MTDVRQTGRWRGVVAIALLAVGAGVLLDRPTVLLVGVVGAGFAVYPQLQGPPTVELDLERHVEDSRPTRGEPVRVTATLTNVGSKTLADVRILDGVPPMLEVASGNPRHSAVLRPGQSTQFSYEVDADHGRHQFDPARVIVRDVTGAHEVETTVPAETEIRVASSVPHVPLRERTDGFSGRVPTDDGGAGTEFHAVREYQRGDPMSRIDSRRWARTGELTTVDFRQERRTATVLLVDARAVAYRAAADETPNAVAHSLAGAEQLVESLSEAQDQVGLAGIGRELCWQRPGTGTEHRETLRHLLAAHPTLSATPSDPEDDADLAGQMDHLRKRLQPNTQVVVFSPLTDAAIVEAVRRLEAMGHSTTVVSPDVTAGGTLGQDLARVERQNRLYELRQAGIPVVDWDPETSLGTVLLNEQRRRRAA